MNQIVVHGILTKEDKKYNLVKELGEEKVYEPNQVYKLAVTRKSGTVDTLMVLSTKDLPEGSVHIEGRLHAEYLPGAGVPVIILPDIVDVEVDATNSFSEAKLIGTLKKKPKCRRTKRGVSIASVVLNTDEGPIPVLLWGSNAIKAEQELKEGDSIQVAGRLQSREYPDKKQNIHVTYELSSYELKTSQDVS